MPSGSPGKWSFAVNVTLKGLGASLLPVAALGVKVNFGVRVPFPVTVAPGGATPDGPLVKL